MCNPAKRAVSSVRSRPDRWVRGRSSGDFRRTRPAARRMAIRSGTLGPRAVLPEERPGDPRLAAPGQGGGRDGRGPRGPRVRDHNRVAFRGGDRALHVRGRSHAGDPVSTPPHGERERGLRAPAACGRRGLGSAGAARGRAEGGEPIARPPVREILVRAFPLALFAALSEWIVIDLVRYAPLEGWGIGGVAPAGAPVAPLPGAWGGGPPPAPRGPGGLASNTFGRGAGGGGWGGRSRR